MINRDVARFYQWDMKSLTQSESAVKTNAFAFQQFDLGKSAMHYNAGIKSSFSGAPPRTTRGYGNPTA